MTTRVPISAAVPVGARSPTIVTWNRLEGVPRSTNFQRSLRAEVRDALWMLARQWQVGEFAAADAGTQVLARVTTESETTQTFYDADDRMSETDLDVPLETRVEREPAQRDLRLAIQISVHWLRLLRARVGDDRYRQLFVEAYPLVGPPSDDARVLQLLAAARARTLDGATLVDDLASGRDAATVTSSSASVADSDKPHVRLAQQDLLAWFGRTASQPDDARTWVPERLEYRFGIGTRAPGGSTTILRAPEYVSGHLDWHDFDVVARTRAAAETKTLALLPTPVTFAGMPSARWWEVEDRRVDFGALDAHPTDLAKLLMMEFGLVYGSDWSIVPVAIPVGGLCRVTSLVVSDVFGQDTTVPSLHAEGSPWAMFTLAGPGGAEAGLFLPPALARVAESAPIECVDLLRDEMANLVWAIETAIPDELGGGVSGREAESRTPPAATTASTPPRYELMGSVPAAWIPFVPMHVPGSTRETQLQRGAMLTAGAQPIRPRGAILVPSGADPYFINEEEVPRAGVRVTRTWQRARWHDGRTFVWLGRRRSVGRGEGSGGLAFDQLKTDPR